MFNTKLIVRSGTLFSADKAQELMGCEYTSKLLFQRTHMLRNYAFWGFSDSVVDGFEQAAASLHDSAVISPKVAIGHVDSLEHVEDKPLGLFATDDLEPLEFLGEYAGVLKVHADGLNHFDPYGISYPSVYESGDLYVSASEYGNVMRCINHSSRPNARFVPMVHGGILRIFCVSALHTCYCIGCVCFLHDASCIIEMDPSAHH